MDEPAPAGGLPDSEDEDEDAHVDAQEEQDDQEAEGNPAGFDRWRTESAVGSVVTGVARGLRDVFAPVPDPPAIVASVPGDPPDADQRVRVILDPDDPTRSIAIVPGEGPPEPPDPPEPSDAT
jgi:hypothetical protein